MDDCVGDENEGDEEGSEEGMEEGDDVDMEEEVVAKKPRKKKEPLEIEYTDMISCLLNVPMKHPFYFMNQTYGSYRIDKFIEIQRNTVIYLP